MSEPWASLVKFLFILAVPLVAIAGGLVTLFAVGALFDALENPESLGQRIEALFRPAPKPAKAPGPDHYYRPYWTR